MNFAAVRFVLVGTTHPGNIGSSARALKTMGFDQLVLVDPQCTIDNRAYEMAAGADDVLEQCRITPTLTDALKDCKLVFATSARVRNLNIPELSPRACAEMVGTTDKAAPIAILFGREHAGLTNAELLQAHFHIVIDSNPLYGSLNLSQAVQILAYELRTQSRLTEPNLIVEKNSLASIDDLERFYQHLTQVLKKTDFLKPSNQIVLTRLRRLFNRALLEETEVNMWRGILTQIEKTIHPTRATE